MGRPKGVQTPHFWNAARKAQVVELLGQGTPRAQIAEIFGKKKVAIDTLLSRYPELKDAKGEATVRHSTTPQQAKHAGLTPAQIGAPVVISWPTDEDVISATCRQFGVRDKAVARSIFDGLKPKMPDVEP
jgi:HD-like signal output (HDOD) protein